MTSTLHLHWPQWQGGEPSAVDALTPELSQEEGRLAYWVGGQIAGLLAPLTDSPKADVPVGVYDSNPQTTDGIVAKSEILAQNAAALALIEDAQPARIVTIGGTCSVSALPFAYLAQRYDNDLAVVWMDSHADSNLPGGPNLGFNTMVVSHLLGHGDPHVLAQLPGHVEPHHVVLAGVHGWSDIDRGNVDEWGLTVVEPAPQDVFVDELIARIHATGCSKVAIHLDLDVIDSHEVAYGMAWEPDGINTSTVVDALARIAASFDLVGLTIAEFVPREAMRLRTLLATIADIGSDATH